MTNSKADYMAKIYLVNEDELNAYLEELKGKYSNIPIEKAMKFNFKIGYIDLPIR